MANRWPETEPFPAAMADRDLMRVLGIQKSLFYRLKAARKFDGLMCRPQLTGNTRYSGVLVRRWVEGGGQWLARRSGAA